jgi:hypothetical protein
MMPSKIALIVAAVPRQPVSPIFLWPVGASATLCISLQLYSYFSVGDKPFGAAYNRSGEESA